MNERALILWLRAQYQVLYDAFEEARATLPADPEPYRERRWNNPFMMMMRAPDEADPPDQWEWVVVPRTHPVLVDIETALEQFAKQINYLEGKEK